MWQRELLLKKTCTDHPEAASDEQRMFKVNRIEKQEGRLGATSCGGALQGVPHFCSHFLGGSKATPPCKGNEVFQLAALPAQYDHLRRDENVLELDSGDGCTAVSMS